jgi:hypothetical protein
VEERVPEGTIHVDILYRTCTGYSSLPEDGTSGSKHGHVEDIMEN